MNGTQKDETTSQKGRVIPMKLGLALSGGGVRGTIHLGIIHALEDSGIHADMYAGTSAGAIVASAKAVGMSNTESLEMLSEIKGDLLDFDYWSVAVGLLTRFSRFESAMKGRKFKDLLHKHFSYGMAEVMYPLSIVTTNITTGTQVVFSTENLNRKLHPDNHIDLYREDLRLDEVIYASAAIPGIFPPLKWNDHKLVDGMLVNNMPTNILNIMGADKIIAISIGQGEGFEEVHNVFDVLGRSLDVLVDQNVDYALSTAKNYLCLYPNMTDIKALDFSRTIEGYERGYAYGQSVAEQVKEFISGTV